MGRPPCCDKVGIKKGPWTPEEDIILVSYIQEHGPGNWRAVPTNTGLMRCSKSCRLRWTNYLRPGIKRGNFTPHEEGMIIHLQALLGNKWAAIATYLPQRTDNDIKNYWNTHLKKKLKKLQSDNLGRPQVSSHHPFVSKSYGHIRSDENMTKSQTSHHENSSSMNDNYASSEGNISRFLDGWMQSSSLSSSSSSPFHVITTTAAIATTIDVNGYNHRGRYYSDFGQTPGSEGSAVTASIPCDRAQGTGDGGTNGMPSDQEMEAIWSVDHHHHHHSIDKSSCDSSRKGSESSGVMDHEQRISPLSFLEKWLLDESGGGQLEGAMELPSLF